MAQVKGIVSYVGFAKRGKARSPIGSIAIGEDDERIFYGTDFDEPVGPDGRRIEPGDLVQFTANASDYGMKCDLSTLKIKRGVAPPPEKPKYNKGAGGKGKVDWAAKDNYWKQKEAYDKKVAGPLLNYKFSLATAKDLILEMHKQELLPAVKTKKDAYDLVKAEILKAGEEIFEIVQEKGYFLEHGESVKGKEEEQTIGEELKELEEADKDDWDEEEWDE